MEKFETKRLFLEPLNLSHQDFIFDLVNTKGWIKFIGNRNIKNLSDAKNYIEKIENNSKTIYWVAVLKETKIPIGIITIIKRDYLEEYDFGFAFLPEYTNKGFAYEASLEVLKNIESNYKNIGAITIEENISSIKLLEKLGFKFDKKIVLAVPKKEELLFYTKKMI